MHTSKSALSTNTRDKQDFGIHHHGIIFKLLVDVCKDASKGKARFNKFVIQCHLLLYAFFSGSG